MVDPTVADGVDEAAAEETRPDGGDSADDPASGDEDPAEAATEAPTEPEAETTGEIDPIYR